MLNDVKVCVDARVNFFSQYYDIPVDVQPEVDAFITEVTALGENSTDVSAFETEFVSSGLSDRFISILPMCTPKAVPVAQEYVDYQRQSEREMLSERKSQIFDTVVSDVTESVTMRIESDAISARNRAMSEAGMLDEYARASNVIDDSRSLLGKLFGRKKNQ